MAEKLAVIIGHRGDILKETQEYEEFQTTEGTYQHGEKSSLTSSGRVLCEQAYEQQILRYSYGHGVHAGGIGLGWENLLSALQRDQPVDRW